MNSKEQQIASRKEQKFQRAMSIKRVEITCDLLGGRISDREATRKINSLPTVRPGLTKKTAEDKVIQSLKGVLCVDQTFNTSLKGYKREELHHDLMASVNGDLFGIYVAVNEERLARFLKTINPGHNHQSDQDRLCQRRLIVLDGSAPESAIQESFSRQLSAINNYQPSR